MKKFVKWLLSALYGLVMIEVVIMISPFAFYWYSLYAPTLQGLHRWRATVNAVNRRLDLTESLTFAMTSEEEVTQFNRALHRDDGYLHGIHELLNQLSQRRW